MLQVEGEECIFKSLFSEDGYELLMVGGMCEVGEGWWPGLVCGEKMDGAEVARRSKVSGQGSMFSDKIAVGGLTLVHSVVCWLQCNIVDTLN